jgi:phosphate transport system substrate-binding protein
MTGRRRFLHWLCSSALVACSNDSAVALNGAGATFPFPLYTKWIAEYRNVAPGVRINYQSIGSGGGVRQVVAGTVDFGATDVPAQPDEERGAPGRLVHVPTAVGSVVVSYNLSGLTSPLKLSPEALASVFLGDIKRWNAPELVALNPALRAFDLAITVVNRTDGSGTTAIFTRYLAGASRAWNERAGSGKTVRWPVGLGAKGNEGVTGQLQATPGSIGYTELAYARQNHLPRAELRNRSGRFVGPSAAGATAAAAGVPMPESLQVWLDSAEDESAYPLAAYTYLLVYENMPDAERGVALARFLWWAIHDGQRFTQHLDYAPLPSRVVTQVETALKRLKAAGKPALAL